MEQHHSTLELGKHDETARAPERDHDATAFELDAIALAPQVVSDTASQVLYDKLYNSFLPEARGDIEESIKERASSRRVTKATHRWVWIFVALVVAAVVAVGAGVGTWLHWDHSTTISPQYILNDTSLAALSSANGDRQLIFQDNFGLIQRAVRSASNGQWSTSSHLNIATFLSESQALPKDNTPFAVIVYEVETDMSIEVFYVSDSHHLVSLFLNTIDTSGIAGFPRLPITGKNYSTAVDTRSLPITLIPGPYSETVPANFTANRALLYYENATGNVSALLRRVIADKERDLTLPWFDITSQNEHHGNFSDAPRVDEFSNGPNFDPLVGSSHTLYESVADTTLSAPFTCKANFLRGSRGGLTSMGALFYAPGNASLVADFFDVGPSGPGNYSGYELIDLASYDSNAVVEGSGKDLNYSLISQSDVATVGRSDAIWINGTQPVTFENAPPNISFPFTRLASVVSADQSMTFLYHQINGTTFAEETWDESLKTWAATEYITVTEKLVP